MIRQGLFCVGLFCKLQVILYYYEFRKQQSDHLHYERKKYKNHIKKSGFNFGHIFPENRRNALIAVWGWCIFSSRGDFTLNWQNVKINSIQTALSKRIFNRNFLHKIFKVNRALHQSFRRRGSCSDQKHENISLSAQNKQLLRILLNDILFFNLQCGTENFYLL